MQCLVFFFLVILGVVDFFFDFLIFFKKLSMSLRFF